MYIYVCMYTRVHRHTLMCAYIHVKTYMHLHLHTHIPFYVSIYIYIHICSPPLRHAEMHFLLPRYPQNHRATDPEIPRIQKIEIQKLKNIKNT